MCIDSVRKFENIGIYLLLIHTPKSWQNFSWPIGITKKTKLRIKIYRPNFDEKWNKLFFFSKWPSLLCSKTLLKPEIHTALNISLSSCYWSTSSCYLPWWKDTFDSAWVPGNPRRWEIRVNLANDVVFSFLERSEIKDCQFLMPFCLQWEQSKWREPSCECSLSCPPLLPSGVQWLCSVVKTLELSP